MRCRRRLNVDPRGLDRVVPRHLGDLLILLLAVPEFDEEGYHLSILKVEEGTKFTRHKGDRGHGMPVTRAGRVLECFSGGGEGGHKGLPRCSIWAELYTGDSLQQVHRYVEGSGLGDYTRASDEHNI